VPRYKGDSGCVRAAGLAPGKNSLYTIRATALSATSRRSPACGPRSGITRSVPRSRIRQRRLAGHLCREMTRAAATLYQNQKDGTLSRRRYRGRRWVFLPMGTAQAACGRHGGDYNRTAGSTLQRLTSPATPTRCTPDWEEVMFEDRTYQAGLGSTRAISAGESAYRYGNDGLARLILLLMAMSSRKSAPWRDGDALCEHKYLYRNLQNGRFEDVTRKGGPGSLRRRFRRVACAFGTTTTMAMSTSSSIA